jgi:hypothetical protein
MRSDLYYKGNEEDFHVLRRIHDESPSRQRKEGLSNSSQNWAIRFFASKSRQRLTSFSFTRLSMFLTPLFLNRFGCTFWNETMSTSGFACYYAHLRYILARKSIPAMKPQE